MGDSLHPSCCDCSRYPSPRCLSRPSCCRRRCPSCRQCWIRCCCPSCCCHLRRRPSSCRSLRRCPSCCRPRIRRCCPSCHRCHCLSNSTTPHHHHINNNNQPP